MDYSAFIRDIVIQKLRTEKGFSCMAAAEINGFHFSAADIALSDGNDSCQVYRIAIIKHNQTTNFE